jgi:hypothetical protein
MSRAGAANVIARGWLGQSLGGIRGRRSDLLGFQQMRHLCRRDPEVEATVVAGGELLALQKHVHSSRFSARESREVYNRVGSSSRDQTEVLIVKRYAERKSRLPLQRDHEPFWLTIELDQCSLTQPRVPARRSPASRLTWRRGWVVSSSADRG